MSYYGQQRLSRPHYHVIPVAKSVQPHVVADIFVPVVLIIYVNVMTVALLLMIIVMTEMIDHYYHNNMLYQDYD